MTEITDANLFNLFAGEQNIEDMRWLGMDIYFLVHRLDIDSETIETEHRSITQSDLQDIKSVFAGKLRSLPTTEYLLLILWLREVKFTMPSLLESDKIDFVQDAFSMNHLNIDAATVEWEFRYCSIRDTLARDSVLVKQLREPIVSRIIFLRRKARVLPKNCSME